jgi:hypothetical protein
VSAVRRYPLISFFVLAYALSWWPWPLYILGLAAGPIIGFGPFFAAVLVLALTGGKAGVVALLRRVVRWRVQPVWCRNRARRPAGRSAPIACRARSLDRAHPHFLPLAARSWPRRRVGGAGVAWLRPPEAAGGTLGALGQPDPWGGVGLLAAAAYGYRADPSFRPSVYRRLDGRVYVVVQQHQQERVDRHADAQHEQHYLGRLPHADVLGGRLGEAGLAAGRAVVRCSDRGGRRYGSRASLSQNTPSRRPCRPRSPRPPLA